MELKDIEPYLVSNGLNISLSQTSANPWKNIPSREEAHLELKELQVKLSDLQEKFYVDRRRKLLIVLQGMDTSGKNSTIRNVFKGVNPQYAHVASFENPLERSQLRFSPGVSIGKFRKRVKLLFLTGVIMRMY